MKKFKVTCSWDSDIGIYNRFIRNYITKNNINENFIITKDNDYDYLAVFNRCRDTSLLSRIPPSNVIGFIMEPSWTNSWDRNIGAYCGKVYFHDEWLLDQNIINIDRFISHPSLMMYHMSNDYIEKYISQTFNKSKRISMIVSKSVINNDNVKLYSARMKLANKILQSDLPIDIYGNGWETCGDSRIKGGLDNKAGGLIDYQYSIAVENSSEKNYLTEKFIDCVLCDTVPIYYGCPNAANIYDINTFISLDLFNDNVINQLRNIIENDNYEKRVDYLNKAKLYYYNNYNIYNILLREFL
jgi:hypothetical protein